MDALGFPGRPPPVRRHLALPEATAAARLHAAFQRKRGPLDNAGDLPEVTFGPNRIARLSAAELEELVGRSHGVARGVTGCPLSPELI